LKKAENRSIVYNHHILVATTEIIQDPIITRLIEATKSDQTIQEITKFDNDKITTDNTGLVYFHRLIYVPRDLRDKVIKLYYDTPLYGYMGTEKIMEHVSRNYYFPNMRKRVERYVQNCAMCQQDKPARHLPYGNL
jgi:hypothetical protein